ncbi:MAG: ABC transporter permease [Gammaproteobacteria bacterium]|nr:ABC transporter permease [Gammaproteobacteria bacterium]
MPSLELLLSVLDSSVRLAAPLVFAALAGLYSERSGVVDIGLEGKMLAAAFAAAAAAAVTQNAWLGLCAGVAASCTLALVHGFACITHKGDHIVSGMAVNILAFGLTVILGIAWFAQGGRTPFLGSDARFSALAFPGADAAAPLPLLGPVYRELLSGHNILVYLAFACVAATAWALYRTRFGLRLRAVGENPAAVDTAGISVAFLRYRAVLICGVLCGFAGAYLSTAQGAAFISGMTAGKGFIALAAMIFGKWRPWPVLSACLLFGFFEAGAAHIQGVSLPLVGAVPVQAVQALPYLFTVVILAGFFGAAVAPRAAGKPYTRGEH